MSDELWPRYPYSGPLSDEVMTVHQKIAENLAFTKDQVLKPPFTIRRKRVNVRSLVILVSVVLLMALIVCASINLWR